MKELNFPNFSHSQINRAGEVLRAKKIKSKEYEEALQIVGEWRACHAYPIKTFKSTLRKKVKKYENPIVAQRLKRLPTILDKLQRYPEMELSRMHDIGGVRAVVNTVEEVRELQKEYHDEQRFTHQLVREDDYVANPKKDGYRGVHLVYKYNNTRARKGNADKFKGLRIELQLRTKLQHEWATAVETLGFIRDESLKSQKGNKEWLNFFKIVSSAFAHLEESNPIQEHKGMRTNEILAELVRQANKMHALVQLEGYAFAARLIHTKYRAGYYKLILLNTKEKTVTIHSYKQDELNKASNHYSYLEKENAYNDEVEIVLVSAGSMKSLMLAYPNYFLDIKQFLEHIRYLIQEEVGGKMDKSKL